MKSQRCPKIEDYLQGSLRSRVSTPAANAKVKKSARKIIDPDEGKELSFLLNQKFPGISPSPFAHHSSLTFLDMSSPIQRLAQSSVPSIGVYKRNDDLNESPSVLRLMSTPGEFSYCSSTLSLPPSTPAPSVVAAVDDCEKGPTVAQFQTVERLKIIAPPPGAMEILRQIRDSSSGLTMTASPLSSGLSLNSTLPDIVDLPKNRIEFLPSAPVLDPLATKESIKLYMLFKKWVSVTSNQCLYILMQMDSGNEGVNKSDWLSSQIFKTVIFRVKTVVFLSWRRRVEIFKVASEFSSHRKLRRGVIAFQVNSNIALLTKKKSFDLKATYITENKESQYLEIVESGNKSSDNSEKGKLQGRIHPNDDLMDMSEQTREFLSLDITSLIALPDSPPLESGNLVIKCKDDDIFLSEEAKLRLKTSEEAFLICTPNQSENEDVLPVAKVSSDFLDGERMNMVDSQGTDSQSSRIKKLKVVDILGLESSITYKQEDLLESSTFGPKLSYRLRLVTTHGKFEFKQVDITYLWFMLLRFRKRTVFHKKIKNIKKLRDGTMMKKFFSVYQKAVVVSKEYRCQLDSFADLHFSRFFLHKRSIYLRKWNRFLQNKRMIFEYTQMIKMKLNLNKSSKQILYLFFRPYVVHGFRALKENYRSLEIRDDEVHLASKCSRFVKIKQGFRRFRLRIRNLKAMREYRDHLHLSRFKFAQAASKNFQSTADDLCTFIEHQALRRAVARFKCRARVTTIFFTKIDALINAAMKSGVFNNILRALFRCRSVLSPKAKQVIMEVKQSLMRGKEKLHSRTDSSRLYAHGYGYLTGKLNSMVDKYLNSSSITPQHAIEHLYLNMSTSTMMTTLSPGDNFLHQLSYIESLSERQNKCKEMHVPALDERGFAIVRAHKSGNATHSENESGSSLNTIFARGSSEDSISQSTLSGSISRDSIKARILAGCYVIEDISLTIFGSMLISYFRRWIRRSKIAARLRRASNTLTTIIKQKVISQTMSTWRDFSISVAMVRKFILTKAFEKVGIFSKNARVSYRNKMRAIQRVLSIGFHMYRHRTLILRAIKNSIQRSNRFLLRFQEEVVYSPQSSFSSLRRLTPSPIELSTLRKSFNAILRRSKQKAKLRKLALPFRALRVLENKRKFYKILSERCRIKRGSNLTSNILLRRVMITLRRIKLSKKLNLRKQFWKWQYCLQMVRLSRGVRWVYESKLKLLVNRWKFFVEDLHTRAKFTKKIDDHYTCKVFFKTIRNVYFASISDRKRQFRYGLWKLKRFYEYRNKVKMFYARKALKRFRHALNSAACLLKLKALKLAQAAHFNNFKESVVVSRNVFPKTETIENVRIPKRHYDKLTNSITCDSEKVILLVKSKHLLKKWLKSRYSRKQKYDKADLMNFNMLQRKGFHDLSNWKQRRKFYAMLDHMSNVYHNGYISRAGLRRWFRRIRAVKAKKNLKQMADDFKTHYSKVNAIQQLWFVAFM